MSSSSDAVAVLGDQEGEVFAGGVPPGRLASIQEPSRTVLGGECPDWLPATEDFIVAGDELIDAGACQGDDSFGEAEETTSQPLFVRNVRGGDWHVLRWLRGHYEPILAAEGNRLAIGVQATRGMRVTILDLGTGHVVARFDTPDGDLSFASNRRLVLSVQERRRRIERKTTRSAAEPRPRRARPVLTEAQPGPAAHEPPYRIELYSLTGRRLAALGTAPEPPLVSHMHVLEERSVEGGSVVAVRGLLGGPSRRLIGFNESPVRKLEAFAIRWPAVAVLETTSAPLSPREVTCHSGRYHDPGEPFVSIFDLARREPFVPPPAPEPLPPLPDNCPVVVFPAS